MPLPFKYYGNALTACIRGTLLVVHNSDFEALDEREGSEYDVQRIKLFFATYFEKIIILENETKSTILYMIKTIAAETAEDPKAGFYLFILTHGDAGGWLAATDCRASGATIDGWYSIEEVVELLHKKMPAKAPKVLIIQACDGDKEDAGEPIRPPAVGDQSPDNSMDESTDAGASRAKRKQLNHSKMPIAANTFVFRSSSHGYVSYLDKKKGSRFIRAFIHNCKHYAPTHDLRYICLRTGRDVALDKQDFKQMPCISMDTLMVTPFLRFPKVVTADGQPPAEQTSDSQQLERAVQAARARQAQIASEKEAQAGPSTQAQPATPAKQTTPAKKAAQSKSARKRKAIENELQLAKQRILMANYFSPKKEEPEPKPEVNGSACKKEDD